MSRPPTIESFHPGIRGARPPGLRRRGPGARRISGALLLAAALLAPRPWAQSAFLVSDGPGNTYPLITAGGYNIEVPDCAHKVEHMSERYDGDLQKNVFAFTMHMVDNDRCKNYDRQRIELRGSGPAQQGAKGRTTHYRWKFKLDQGFKETPNFTHIFQIKAYGNGHGSGAPIVTITPRLSNRMEIYHRGTVKSTSLSKFRGIWVEAYVKARHDNGGSLDVTLKRVSDGEILHSYSASNIDMWDDGAGYGAPKFGLYRSLNSRSSMRDEDVLFADFAATLGEVEAPLTVHALTRHAARAFALHPVTGGRASFSLDQGGHCRIGILDPSGRLVIPPLLLEGAPGLNRLDLPALPRHPGPYVLQLEFQGMRRAALFTSP